MQSNFGAQLPEIQQQLHGAPLPASRHWQSQLGSLWSYPLDPHSTVGLGGGVTYAWDPELCVKLMCAAACP